MLTEAEIDLTTGASACFITGAESLAGAGLLPIAAVVADFYRTFDLLNRGAAIEAGPIVAEARLNTMPRITWARLRQVCGALFAQAIRRQVRPITVERLEVIQSAARTGSQIPRVELDV